MKVHFIIHESFESPAAIEQWARSKQYCVTSTRVYAGEKLPKDPHGFDFLVVMGGPQSPATTLEECPYFDTAAEQDFIKRAITSNKAVLGVCLGAQLIGEALGAKSSSSPNKEIGIFDVILTDAAKKDRIFSKFPSSFPVAHWHGDMPGLTKEAQLLAYSEGCPRQIIRYTPRVYGFQCHFEFNKEAVEGMVRNCAADFKTAGKYIQDEAMLLDYPYEEINKKLFIFLSHVENSFNLCVS